MTEENELGGSEPKVVAAIPCYNEAGFIKDIVQRTQAYVHTVVIVDDGSTDGTSKVARASGAEVIEPEDRSGCCGGVGAPH